MKMWKDESLKWEQFVIDVALILLIFLGSFKCGGLWCNIKSPKKHSITFPRSPLSLSSFIMFMPFCYSQSLRFAVFNSTLALPHNFHVFVASSSPPRKFVWRFTRAEFLFLCEYRARPANEAKPNFSPNLCLIQSSQCENRM